MDCWVLLLEELLHILNRQVLLLQHDPTPTPQKKAHSSTIPSACGRAGSHRLSRQLRDAVTEGKGPICCGLAVVLLVLPTGRVCPLRGERVWRRLCE